MKELTSHIEFLLLENQYVIIPNLGGFVINREPAQVDSQGFILPPSLSFGFNSELKYNDGLLAESYMKINGFSFETSCKRIEDSVKTIKANFAEGKDVDFGKLGVLSFSNNHIVYTPKSTTILTHPEIWGYSKLNIGRLVDNHLEETTPSKKKVYLRQFAVYAGTAAVAALFLMTPINRDVLDKVQQSGFLINTTDSITHTISKGSNFIASNQFISAKIDSLKNNIEKKSIEIAKTKEDLKKKEVLRAKLVAETNKASYDRLYYIIIGGDTDRSVASRLLAKTKASGFNNASLIESDGRYRIYVATFHDKTEANKYLNRFRINNPEHGDAWLHSQR